MRYLIVVHLEPDFDQTGDLEILAKKIVRYSNTFDGVINITSADSLTGTKPFDIVQANFWDNREWIWGINLEDYTEDAEDNPWKLGENYIEASGHEYAEILDWMHELDKHAHYTLVGGARRECLQDIFDICQHLKLKTKVKEELTYG
jgi:hypothetical protein